MSYEHRVYPDLSLGVVTLTDTIRAPDLLSALTGLYTDPAWQPGYRTLWDARRMTELYILSDDMDAFKERSSGLAGRQGKGRLAVVVARRGHGDMAEIVLARRRREGREAEVFRELDNALKWLGVEKAPPDLLENA